MPYTAEEMPLWNLLIMHRPHEKAEKDLRAGSPRSATCIKFRMIVWTCVHVGTYGSDVVDAYECYVSNNAVNRSFVQHPADVAFL
jgi:hypothetical protein